MAADDQEELLQMRKRVHDLNNVVQATVLKHATIASSVEHLVEAFKEHRDDSKTFMRECTNDLREIKEQTTKTNGRVNLLDERTEQQARELGRLNAAAIGRPAPVSESSESIFLRMSPKVWTALAAAGGMLFAMAVETLKEWLKRP